MIKKYWILLTISLANYAQAQQYGYSYDYYSDNHPYPLNYAYYDQAPAQESSNKQSVNASQAKSDSSDKSTASSDATQSDKENTKDKKVDDKNKKDEEKPKSPHTFTGSISFVSDYRFRGI